MSNTESNLSTHECEWCGIRTPDVRSACMACGTQSGLPNLDAGSFVDSDPIVKTAYLNGAFSDIASRIHSKRIRWTKNEIAQRAILIALTQEYMKMNIILELPQEEAKEVVVGWSWPRAPFVSGATISVVEGGKLTGRHIVKRGRAHDMGINFQMPSHIDTATASVHLSLFTEVGPDRLNMYPRRVKPTNKQSSSSEK